MQQKNKLVLNSYFLNQDEPQMRHDLGNDAARRSW